MTTTDHAIVAPAVTGDPGTRDDAGGFDPALPFSDIVGSDVLCIVCDGPPGPYAGRFVEAETLDGRSVNAGRWEEYGKFWRLVIPGRLSLSEEAVDAADDAYTEEFDKGERFEDDPRIRSRARHTRAIRAALHAAVNVAPDPIPQPEGDTPSAPALHEAFVDHEKMRWDAEQARCVSMALDDLGVPHRDHVGDLSLVGRVMRFGETCSTPPAPAQSAGAAADGEDDAAMHALAEAWATMDGKIDAYRREMKLFAESEEIDREAVGYTGHYEGYQCEAQSMIERLARRGFVIARRAARPHEPADASARSARGEVAEAVLGEREACAKTVQDLLDVETDALRYYGSSGNREGEAGLLRGLERAFAAIRARPTPAAVLDRARPAGQGEGEGDGWLPIATAPRVGTRILYVTPLKHSFEFGVAYFDEGAWFCDASGADINPVFWRPLPAPPSTAAPPAPASRNAEDDAWAWMHKQFTNVEAGHDPNDRDYGADDMVDAFIAGAARRATSAPAQDAVPAGVTEAAKDVLAERRRQVEGEGWTPEHDDAHQSGEMASAAASYATQGRYHNPEPGKPGTLWPWAPSWWKPSSYRRNLVKAGALILAEIERLDRAAARARTPDAGKEKVRAKDRKATARQAKKDAEPESYADMAIEAQQLRDAGLPVPEDIAWLIP